MDEENEYEHDEYKLCLDYLLFEEEEFDSIEIENTFAYIFDKDGKFHGTEY